jgi:hypothetical protein
LSDRIQTTVRFEKELHKRLKIESVQRGIKVQDIIFEGVDLWLRSKSGIADPQETKPRLPSKGEQELAEKFLAFWRTASKEQRKIVEMIISAELSARVAGRRQSAPAKEA